MGNNERGGLNALQTTLNNNSTMDKKDDELMLFSATAQDEGKTQLEKLSQTEANVSKGVIPTLKSLSGAIQDVSKWFGDLNGTMGTIINTLGLVGENFSFASEAMNKLTEFANIAVDSIGRIQGFIEMSQGIMDSVLQVQETFSSLSTVISQISPAISSISAPILIIVAIIALIIAAIVQLWNTNEEFRNALTEAWNGIVETLNLAWSELIKPIFDSLIENLLLIWEGGIKPLWDKWVDFVGTIIIAMTELWDSIKPLIDWMIQTFGPIIADVFDFVVENIANNVNLVLGVIGGLLDNIGIYVKGIIDVFSGMIDFITGIFTGDWKKAWDGVKKIFSGIVNTFFGIFENVWNMILGLFSNGGKIFGGIIEGIGGIFTSIVNHLIDGLNQVISSPFKFLNGILNEIRSFKIPVVGKVFEGLWGKNPIPVPQIPKLAKGGTLANGLALVGEAGPELLMQMGNRTTVTPLSRGGGAEPYNLIDYDKMSISFINAIKHLSLVISDEEMGEIVDRRLLRVM